MHDTLILRLATHLAYIQLTPVLSPSGNAYQRMIDAARLTLFSAVNPITHNKIHSQITGRVYKCTIYIITNKHSSIYSVMYIRMYMQIKFKISPVGKLNSREIYSTKV